jgi:hypothetical protein
MGVGAWALGPRDAGQFFGRFALHVESDKEGRQLRIGCAAMQDGLHGGVRINGAQVAARGYGMKIRQQH